MHDDDNGRAFPRRAPPAALQLTAHAVLRIVAGRDAAMPSGSVGSLARGSPCRPRGRAGTGEGGGFMGLFDLGGRVVLVTGATRGLGLAMADALAEAGAHVIVNGRDPATVEGCVDRLRVRGAGASPAPFDVCDEAGMTRALAVVVEEHGRLDAVFANAGINRRAPLLEVTAEDARTQFETNAVSVLLLAREAARIMIPRKSGRIVLLGSVAGAGGRPGIHAYAATKAAVMGMVRTLAAELGPHGINVNGIAPGFFRTDMNAEVLADPQLAGFMEGRTALGRWGDPQELGGTAVFLASDASSYLTGQTIAVDGGTLALL
jgi:gluconate 5-dehydrogenase